MRNYDTRKKSKRISVKEAICRGFRRTGYKFRKGLSYYKPSVFKQLKTGKKVAIILRPFWMALLVVAIVFGARWWSLFDSIFVEDTPVDRPGDYVMDTDIPDDVEDVVSKNSGITVDIIDEPIISSKIVPIYKKDQKDKNVINIMLMGSDTRVAGQRSRTDSMMVASYNKNTNSLSILSLMRDSLVPIEGHGWTKLCHANAYGGPGLLLNTVNDSFDLDIQAYVVIDFFSFQEVIDKIDGIDLQITAAEAAYYGWNKGKAGIVHLNGEMALEHSRNRTIGSDFARTERQRNIVNAVYEKVRNLSIVKQVSLIEYLMTKVTTNISKTTFISLASDVLTSGIPTINNGRMPFDGCWTNASYKGMSVLKVNFDKNRIAVNDFIYAPISVTDKQ